VAALAACAAREPVTLPPEPTAAAPAAAPTPSAFAFPETCDDLVAPAVLSEVVSAAFPGDATRVYAGPLRSAGRTQRLTCSYGVPEGDGDQPAAVALSLNEYVDAATAAQRQAVTVDAARTAGQQVTEAVLGGQPGHLLRDDATVSAVVAVDDRTIVATLRRGLVPEAAEPVVLDGLAAAMLRLPVPSVPGGGEPEATDPWGAAQ
jgi:hypothetical protein